MLRHLGHFVPRPLTGGLPLDPAGGLPFPRPPGPPPRISGSPLPPNCGSLEPPLKMLLYKFSLEYFLRMSGRGFGHGCC